MAKTKGFNVIIRAFVPVDQDDFRAQSATHAMMADMQEKQTVPEGFLEAAQGIKVSAKLGSAAEEPASAVTAT